MSGGADIHVQIDRIVLNDFDVSPRDGAALQAVIENELASLITKRGRDAIAGSNAAPKADKDPISTTVSEGSTTAVGQSIARIIFERLTR